MISALDMLVLLQAVPEGLAVKAETDASSGEEAFAACLQKLLYTDLAQVSEIPEAMAELEEEDQQDLTPALSAGGAAVMVPPADSTQLAVKAAEAGQREDIALEQAPVLAQQLPPPEMGEAELPVAVSSVVDAAVADQRLLATQPVAEPVRQELLLPEPEQETTALPPLPEGVAQVQVMREKPQDLIAWGQMQRFWLQRNAREPASAAMPVSPLTSASLEIEQGLLTQPKELEQGQEVNQRIDGQTEEAVQLRPNKAILAHSTGEEAEEMVVAERTLPVHSPPEEATEDIPLRVLSWQPELGATAIDEHVTVGTYQAGRATPLRQQLEHGINMGLRLRWQQAPETVTVRLQLYPEELGEVRVELKFSGETLHARLQSARPATIEALREHLPALRLTLSDQGFSNVFVGTELGGQFGAAAGEEQRRFWAEQNRRPLAVVKTEETTTDQTMVSLPGESRLDYRL